MGNFNNDRGIDNYSGQFNALGVNVSLPFLRLGINGQAFASPDFSMSGAAVGVGIGIDALPAPGSTAGTTSGYTRLNRAAFHRPGVHTADNHPTFVDAQRFMAFIAMGALNNSGFQAGRLWAMGMVLENGRRWEQYDGP